VRGFVIAKSDVAREKLTPCPGTGFIIATWKNPPMPTVPSKECPPVRKRLLITPVKLKKSFVPYPGGAVGSAVVVCWKLGVISILTGIFDQGPLPPPWV
jgi:hypothetical protein